jgi:hypothetical protein
VSTLIDFLAVASAVISGISLLAFWAGIRTERKHSEEDRGWLRSELVQANDRLFAASREPGVVVPPREPESAPAIELPSELERLVGDWESPDVQAQLRAQFIRQLGDGHSVSDIKRRHLES